MGSCLTLVGMNSDVRTTEDDPAHASEARANKVSPVTNQGTPNIQSKRDS